MAVTDLSSRRVSGGLFGVIGARAGAGSQGESPAFLSRRALQRALGALWLLDGALQLFPSMWTSHLVDDVMRPTLAGQPGLVSAVLQPGITLASHYVVLTNALIAVVQLALGLCLLTGRGVRAALLGSVAWSVLVWAGGEGFGMLLTGQAGALTGAPGAVLFYALLALAALPRTAVDEGILSRRQLQKGLALLWALAAALQLQPYWWQQGQIVSTITANKQPGTLSGAVLDGSIGWIAGVLGSAEPVVNVSFIAIALLLAIGLAVTGPGKGRPLLVVSMILSLAMWWAAQGFGLILTGGATDVNSGVLLFLCTLACWPRVGRIVQRQTYAAMQPGNA